MKNMTTWQPAARLVCTPPARLRYGADGVRVEAEIDAIVTAVAVASAGATSAFTRATVQRDVLARPGTFAVVAAAPGAGMSAVANPAPATAMGRHAASALKQHLVRGPSRDPA